MDPPRQPFPILSNRQIYPEARKSRSDLNGSTTSLNSESNFGSRKYLNLIQDGSKFCLVQSNTLGKNCKFEEVILVRVVNEQKFQLLEHFDPIIFDQNNISSRKNSSKFRAEHKSSRLFSNTV